MHGADSRQWLEDEYQVQIVAQFTECIGHHCVMRQADLGGVVGAFIGRVYELRSTLAFMRASPKGSKGSQCVVESTHWSVEGLL